MAALGSGVRPRASASVADSNVSVEAASGRSTRKAGAGDDLEVRAAAEELLRMIEEQSPRQTGPMGARPSRVEAEGRSR